MHDLTNLGNGMYALEIPASGGTVDNDTEGFGWWSGDCTATLSWRGPVILFRSVAMNNLMVDVGAPLTAANITDDWETQSTANPDGFRVNVKKINETATQLEMLMDLTTGVATDGDLAPAVVDNSVLAHMMGEAADVTAYKASTDAMSLGGGSAAAIADEVWDSLKSNHVIRNSFGWVLGEILNNTSW